MSEENCISTKPPSFIRAVNYCFSELEKLQIESTLVERLKSVFLDALRIAEGPETVVPDLNTVVQEASPQDAVPLGEVEEENKEDLPPWKCGLCGEAYWNKRGLSDHVSNIHRMGRRGASFWTCEVCGKSKKSERELKRHLETCHQEKVKCHVCELEMSKGWLQQHLRTHSGQEQRCGECYKVYPSIEQLTKHVRQVHRNEQVECAVCGLQMKQRSLQKHLQNHKGENHPCLQCEKTFSCEQQLVAHVRWVHTEERHVCYICGNSLKSKGALARHITVHEEATGDFECETCKKCFRSQRLLDDHKKRHNQPLKHQCAECGKQFKTLVGYRKHSMIHAGILPFKCTECDKAFAVRGEYNLHMRLHSNDRRYRCSICQKAYLIKQTLDEHMNTHTGKRPYSCSYCGDSFAYRGAMFTHIKLKHKRGVGAQLEEQQSGEEKQFPCSYLCGEIFLYRSAMLAHVKMKHSVPEVEEHIVDTEILRSEPETSLTELVSSL